MELMKAILERRSVRHYDATKPITDEDLKTVLTAAMYAPSAMNKQPWEFIVIRDKKLLDTIRDFHPYASFISEARTAVVVCENTQNVFGKYGAIDVALASQNLMLAAHDLGYGTCYCGLYTDDEWLRQFNQLLNIPSHITAFGLIAIGTPTKVSDMPKRFEESKIHYNVW